MSTVDCLGKNASGMSGNMSNRKVLIVAASLAGNGAGMGKEGDIGEKVLEYAYLL